MNPQREHALRQRQLQLLLRSDVLRQRLGAQAQVLQRPLAWVDGVRTGWHWLRANPQWPLAGALALAVLRPRRALRWSTQLFWVWRVMRRAKHFLETESRR